MVDEEGKRDGQASAQVDGERRGEQHSLRPEQVAQDRADEPVESERRYGVRREPS